jgi:hypothetical protein
MNNIFKALKSLLPGKSWKLKGDPTSQQDFEVMFEIVTGKTKDNDAIYSTNPNDFGVTWSEIQAEIVRLQAEYEAKEYQRDRAVAYPSIQEQLDLLYWDKVNGTNNWEAAIEAVKTEYPKP